MNVRKTLARRYYRLRGRIGRYSRLVFMSPAEARLLGLMGGKYFTIGFLKHYKTKFPVTIVLSRGKIFRQERVKREVRIGKYYVDFCNDLGRIIEVDGHHWHMDIVADLQREGYLIERGFTQILRIPAHKLWRDADKVQRDVLKFLLT